jgi:hypothetical protein
MSKATLKLTERQQWMIDQLRKIGGPIVTNYDGAVLRALEKKGLVVRHQNQGSGDAYLTWTLAK